MSDQVHGHDVMQMMLNSGKSFTKESLNKEIIEKFGVEARFYTCSVKGMTSSELIEFLESRGKFVTTDKGFSTDPSKICSHDENHND